MPVFPRHHHRFFFLLLLLYVSHVAGTPVPGTRRSLHQPFLPTGSGNPSPPPATPFTPKPSSSGSGGGGSQFFPLNPTPTATTNRPPAAIPSVTIPANLSGLAWPTLARNGSNDAKKVIIAVVVSLIALAAVLTVILFFRCRSSGEFSWKATRSTSIRLFSAGGPGSAASKDGVANGSDVLYLGTQVDSHRPQGEDSPVVSPQNRKLSSPASFHQRSPDLHPLPPLSRPCWPSEDGGESTDDGDNESFYSLRASSSRNHHESPDAGEDSQRVFLMHSTTRPDFGGGSIATTPSYPSSQTTSPVASKALSPELDTESSTSDGPTHDSFRLPPSSSPMTLDQRNILPSPPSSPSEKSTASDKSTVSGKQSLSGQPAPPRQTIFPIKLPPPPPPPPPKGSLCQFSTPPPPPSRPIFRPPPLITPKRNSQSMKTESSPEAKSQGKPTSPENEQPAENSVDNPRPKLKPLHWDKVWASSDRVMVWDQLKASSFQLNEEMIETLFVCNPTNAAPKEPNRRAVLTSPVQEKRVLDPKKSQNLAILLRALNVTKEEVCNALSEGNTDGLGAELLETLLKMAPTKEEELKLKGHTENGNSKLGTAERFLKAVLDIPFAFKRVDAMLYMANFDSEISYLRKSFQTLEAACEELKSSRLFLKLLEAVLKTGNRMNVGTNRGDAQAFKLDTLLKLVDVKGTDGKTTLLHFVVQEIIRSEEAHLANPRAPSADLSNAGNARKLGLQVVAALSGELSNVKKASSMDSDVLASSVRKLAAGLEKVSDALRLSGDDEANSQFASSMSSFKTKAEEEIVRIRAEENAALSLVKEITEYFHGNAAREEAHPFRIFVIVSDFLDVLDRVCKQVGRMQQQTAVASAGRQLPVPANPMLTPAALVFRRRWTDSDEDSGSSSS